MQNAGYSDQAVKRSLASVLASRQFSTSPRQTQLLTYLVEETLAGRSDQLKGYGIGVDVFGRDPGFDPAEDSIVRVHMSRLRSLLDEYYAGNQGRDDPAIVLRPGTYVPQFEPPAKPDDTPPLSRKWGLGIGTEVTPERAIILGLVALIMAMLFWDELRPANEMDVATAQPEGPSVAVAAFQVNGTERVLAQQLRSGLQHEIVSYLSQLPNLAVLGYDTVDDREFSTLEERRVADFVLVGTITVDDTGFIVNSSLVRTLDQEVVWSQRSAPTALGTANFLTVQSEIALAIAAELGEPYGVIHQSMRTNVALQQDIALSDYFCELRAYNYMQTKDAIERARVRQCLQGAVERMPEYSDALALLAWIQGEEGRLATGVTNADTASDLGSPAQLAQQSLSYAQRAVQANTINAMAYSQLALAQYFNRNDATARASIERALRISPNNTEILANAAWLYASWGEPDVSRALADKAITLNPSHPPWYWLGPALRMLDTGNAPEALRYAQLYAQENSLHSRYVLAAALRLNGHSQDADQVIADTAEEFALTMPELRANLRAWRLPEAVIALTLGEGGG